jgi:hypothetical protein
VQPRQQQRVAIPDGLRHQTTVVRTAAIERQARHLAAAFFRRNSRGTVRPRGVLWSLGLPSHGRRVAGEGRQYCLCGVQVTSDKKKAATERKSRFLFSSAMVRQVCIDFFWGRGGGGGGFVPTEFFIYLGLLGPAQTMRSFSSLLSLCYHHAGGSIRDHAPYEFCLLRFVDINLVFFLFLFLFVVVLFFLFLFLFVVFLFLPIEEFVFDHPFHRALASMHEDPRVERERMRFRYHEILSSWPCHSPSSCAARARGQIPNGMKHISLTSA